MTTTRHVQLAVADSTRVNSALSSLTNVLQFVEWQCTQALVCVDC